MAPQGAGVLQRLRLGALRPSRQRLAPRLAWRGPAAPRAAQEQVARLWQLWRVRLAVQQVLWPVWEQALQA